MTLIGIDHTAGAGGLVGTAEVELVVAGVGITIRGVQLVRISPTRIEVRSPAHRRAGEWHGSIVLPPEIADAVTDLVLAAWREGM